MKKVILIACTLILSTANVKSQTTIPGGVVSGTWTQTGSPYIVQNAIMIPNDSTLTIEPGVKVEFQGSYKFWVLGRLIAIGTVSDTIEFTCSDTIIGWLGIRYDNSTSTDTSIFKFCKFSYGKAGAAPYTWGGGICFYSFTKAILSNSRFTRCYAYNTAGAVQGNISIKNCLFDRNHAASAGAVICGGTNVEISHNVFIENISTSDYSGAIVCNGNFTIHDNVFYNNITLASGFSGGAIYCGSSNTVNIYNNKFFNNSAPNGGGGAIYCYNTPPIISNNIFSNNQSLMGGAIYFYAGSTGSTIINNTMMNNSANYGGAMYCSGIATNHDIVNNIMWGNTASISGDQIYLQYENSDPNITYCDLQGGLSSIGLASNIFYTGTYSNNLNADPLVVNPSAGSGLNYNGLQTDLSLTGNSPCINSGNPSGVYPSVDIAGNPRVFNSIIDVGAYELQGYLGEIDYNFQDKLNVYPNPTNESFILVVPNDFKKDQSLTLKLYDSTGRLVKQTSLNTNQNVYSISLRNESLGLYYLTLTGENRNYISKIVRSN
jgi:hypothetical protein